MQNLSLVVVIFIMAGCSTTNKKTQQSNLKTPEQNNAFISGIVSGDKYIAMDNSFTINLPFKKGSREYGLMEIDEFYHENGAA